MSGAPENRGPPEDSPGRGPPERVKNKFKRASSTDDGTITVSDDPISELADNVDWDNLSPFEEYVLAIMAEEGLLPDEDK